MKIPSKLRFFFLLITCSIIASSGNHLGGHSSNRIRSINDIFRGYNRPLSYDRDLFDVHCYDTIGVRTVHDDCWNSPKTTDIIIRSRDETSRINSRRFAIVDSFGGSELIGGYPDVYETDLVASPTGLGINCFDTIGVRIQYDDCWSSPRTRNILVTGRGRSDTRINSRRFGVASTYYGGSPLVSLVEEVEDCYCVTQDKYYGDSRGILYVKMRPEYVFTTDIRTRLLSLNWGDLNGCVPYDVIEVPYLPYVSNDYRLY